MPNRTQSTLFLAYTRPLLALCAALSILLLTACPDGTGMRPSPGYTPPVATDPNSSPSDLGGDAQADQLAAGGDYAAAAKRYTLLANQIGGEIRNDYLLRSTEFWLLADNHAQARLTLRSITASSLTTDENYQFKLLDATTSLRENREEAALRTLDIPLTSWPETQRLRALKIRSQAAIRSGKLAKGISGFIQRGEALVGSDADQNEDLLWKELSGAPLEAGQMNSDNETVQGWIELAQIGQSIWLAPQALQTQLNDWTSRYSLHPANNRIVANILMPSANPNMGDGSYPVQVALLLPISGRYKGVGEAVRNGFMHSWFEDSGSATRPEVRVYDTKGTPEGALEAYQKSVREGNMMVIGPVLRPSVDAIVDSSSSFGANVVPMLALNQATNPSLYRNASLLQFSLSPSDESRDAAEYLHRSGYTRGMAFVPDSDAGRRQYDIFVQRTLQLGGEIVDVHYYDPEETDFRKALREMASFKPSKSRRNELNSTIGLRVAYEPRTQGDVEYMFLIANPTHGRLLKPQLKYINAGDIPIFATSTVYTGRHEQIADRDMNGMQFNSTPWGIEARPELAEIRETFQSNWPKEFFRNHKIYPLGLDAYYLIPVAWGSADAQWSINGASGRLSAGRNQIVKRQLAWAEFDNGLPRIVDALDNNGVTDLDYDQNFNDNNRFDF